MGRSDLGKCFRQIGSLHRAGNAVNIDHAVIGDRVVAGCLGEAHRAFVIGLEAESRASNRQGAVLSDCERAFLGLDGLGDRQAAAVNRDRTGRSVEVSYSDRAVLEIGSAANLEALIGISAATDINRRVRTRNECVRVVNQCVLHIELAAVEVERAVREGEGLFSTRHFRISRHIELGAVVQRQGFKLEVVDKRRIRSALCDKHAGVNRAVNRQRVDIN